MIREAAVIGKPISHSLSPAIFSFLAHKSRIDGDAGLQDFAYRACEITTEELSDFVLRFRENPAGIGLNVTIPHKTSIMSLLDEIRPEAQAIGAVNVVHREGASNGAGKLVGFNTDLQGVRRTFEKHRVSISGCHAILIGAGGAARSVAYALAASGAAQVAVVNSDRARAQGLCETMSSRFPGTEFRFFSSFASFEGLDHPRWDVVVQATPLGMDSHGKTRDGISAEDYFSRLKPLSFSRDAVAFDLIYRPEKTVFLDVAKKLGLKPLGGLDMLVEQALETWKIWFGEELRLDLSEYLRNRPIFLTGFMGAGKSTIGPLLAMLLNWRFIETDDEIERKAGMKIADIFKTKGERFFRELESQVVLEHAFSSRTVVSLGGGALTHSGTRELLNRGGRLVFLSADAETLNSRLQHTAQKRPLLAGLNDRERKEKISALLQEREALYHQSAFQISTTRLSAEQVAKKIRDHFL